MKKIFEYNNFRKFLKDYYLEKKRTTGYFTYRYFARIAGFSSPVFIKLVIDGKSNLGETSITKIIRSMELLPSESKYFKTLVLFNQAKTSEKKKEYLKGLRSLNTEYRVQVLDSDKYDFYSKWYHSVLRELAPNVNTNTNSKSLGEMVLPSLKVSETKKAIELLGKNGLLKKKKNGSYYQPKKLISTGTEIESLAVRDLHKQMAYLGADAIEKVPKEERDISGLTIGISEKTFDIIKNELKELREKIMTLVVEDQKVERVYRLNMQLFPLSKKIEENRR